MIRRLLCALRGHRMCRYYPPWAPWKCRGGRESETDREWIQRVMSS